MGEATTGEMAIIELSIINKGWMGRETPQSTRGDQTFTLPLFT